MAGNIIPAIATTNAIISGLIVLQALQLLRKNYNALRNVHIQFKPSVPLSSVRISPPNKECGICRDTYSLVQCDPSRTTLGEVVRGILGEDEREVGVYEDNRILSDPDWTVNYEKTLESLNVKQGMFLSIVDEDGDVNTISVGIASLPYVFLPFQCFVGFDCIFSSYRQNHPVNAPHLILPNPLPSPPPKYKPPPPAPETPQKGEKRPFTIEVEEDGVLNFEPTPKKSKPTVPASTSNKRKFEDNPSPSKKRKLEEDGLVLMDDADEQLVDVPEVPGTDADVIVIDDD